MTSFRIISLLLLAGFACFSLRWEVEQVSMWADMIQEASPETSWWQAAEQSLSGQAPCSKCKELSVRQVTGSSEEGFQLPESPSPDILSPLGLMFFHPRAAQIFSVSGLQTLSLKRSRPPTPPPREFQKYSHLSLI